MVEINLNYLNKLGGNDIYFTIEMLETYLEETTEDIIELEHALDSDNLNRIAFISHKIKAAFQMIGLDNATDIAQSIELTAKQTKLPSKVLRIPVRSLIEEAGESFEEVQKIIRELKSQ